MCLTGADPGFLEGELTQGSNLWSGDLHAGTKGSGGMPPPPTFPTEENFKNRC